VRSWGTIQLAYEVTVIEQGSFIELPNRLAASRSVKVNKFRMGMGMVGLVVALALGSSVRTAGTTGGGALITWRQAGFVIHASSNLIPPATRVDHLVLSDGPDGSRALCPPVAAHNCYDYVGKSNARFVEALKLGIDNIEIDLGWDESAKRLIVGHDAAPRKGREYADFASDVVPALEAHWQAHRDHRVPSVLTIDWKTNRAEAVEHFKAFLDGHADWFSSAPKALESPLTRRGLTVCFTGSDEAKVHYENLVTRGGVYRAFRDRVFGATDYRPNVEDYVAEPASAYFRFLAFHWGVIEPNGPPRAGEWTEAKEERLHALVALAHKRGFRVRFYCLNARRSVFGLAYAFPDMSSARLRWRAAAAAGVDWIATDDYGDIMTELRPAERRESAK
jgi:hypothetical protein